MHLQLCSRFTLTLRAFILAALALLAGPLAVEKPSNQRDNHNLSYKMSDPPRKDPAWKFATKVEQSQGAKKGYKYLKCNFCSQVIKGVKRVKDHLACTHDNVAPCKQVHDEVKNEIKNYLKTFEERKHSKQRDFKEMVDSGTYVGSGASGALSLESKDSCPSDRGLRGPLDRFLIDETQDDKEIPMHLLQSTGVKFV